MSRMDLTPNPPDTEHTPAPVEPAAAAFPPVARPSARDAPTTVFRAVTATPPAAPLEPGHAQPPAPAPSQTWNAPPVTWRAVRPEPVHGPPWAPSRGFVAPAVEPEETSAFPGSAGEHLLQFAYGSSKRAERFYSDQVLDHLNEQMTEFIGRMELAFIATADAHGEADCSPRSGPAGFIQVLDTKRIAYPEYRGNGVLASLGNISENPHVGMLLLDFTRDQIGLHVNGRARIVEDADLRLEFSGILRETVRGRIPERWVVVEIEESYIHCRKHIPRLRPVGKEERDWGTDDMKRKGGDYFGVRAEQRAATKANDCGSEEPGALARE